MKFQKGSVRKIPKPKKEKGESRASVESFISLKTHNGVVHKDLSGLHHTDQTIQIQGIHIREIRRSANNVDADIERPKYSKKKSKIRQVVVVMPKESTGTPDAAENQDQSSIVPTEREKSGRTVVFKSMIKRRYDQDERPYDLSTDSPNERSGIPRSHSYYQMNFTKDMNEEYQAKPIFGISPKFKLAELKSQEKPKWKIQI